jgi:hypothetical protein
MAVPSRYNHKNPKQEYFHHKRGFSVQSFSFVTLKSEGLDSNWGGENICYTAHGQLFGFFATYLRAGMAHKSYLACRDNPLYLHTVNFSCFFATYLRAGMVHKSYLACRDNPLYLHTVNFSVFL